MHKQMTAKRKQQILIVVCCMVYGFAYAGRYGYNANIAPIMEFYGITRAEAGLVSTCFFFAYGTMQLVHGILCRFYPKKIVIPAALFLSAALNLTVFFQPPFAAIKYLWLVNGICQSVLWPSLVLTLGETLEPGMMKQAVFVISLATMFGTLISYGGSALFNLFAFFRGSFLLGAVLTVLIGLIWLFSYDRLTAERYVASAGEITTAEKSRKALGGGLVGFLSVCVLFAAVCNFVKDGLSTWTPVILKEQFGLGDSASMILTLILPVFGLFGSMLALAVNRKIRDYRLMAAAAVLPGRRRGADAGAARRDFLPCLCGQQCGDQHDAAGDARPCELRLFGGADEQRDLHRQHRERLRAWAYRRWRGVERGHSGYAWRIGAFRACRNRLRRAAPFPVTKWFLPLDKSRRFCYNGSRRTARKRCAVPRNGPEGKRRKIECWKF